MTQPRTAADVLHGARAQERLNEYYQWFVDAYRPKADGDQEWVHRQRFDGDLMQLVRLIYEDAQRPFVYELKMFRDATLSQAYPAHPIVSKDKEAPK